MRNDIVHIGADELKYEIRGIIDVAKKLENTGLNMTWENIGDPVAKGHHIPEWMKEIIKEELENDLTYAYCPTKGLQDTREFLAKHNNVRGGAQITAEDILFFNGLGDAISTFYNYLRRQVRVLGPAPAYSTHSSAEGAHAGAPHLTYDLDPHNNWMPDLEDIYNKVKYNPQISGVLIINPDNPTGAVYPKEVLDRIVEIAKEFDLFILADEIYQTTYFNGEEFVSLAEVIGDVPGISMKGISKEFPWPGSRCGWIESYNKDKDEIFARFVKTLEDAKMLEVCSTTHPQKTIPKVMQHPEYDNYHKQRNAFFERRSNEVYETLKDIDGLVINRTNGAFYFSVVFENNALNNNQKLDISAEHEVIISPELVGAENDKRFALYLMAHTGICVVPLTGFNCSLQGFRMTLLESDDEKFTWICQQLKEAIQNYLQS